MASHSDGNDNFSLMQHLIHEMDASNQRIDLFSKKYDNESADKYSVAPPKKPSSMERQFEVLYDEAWKSEESDGASLQEVPVHVSCNDAEDSGCEEVVNSAIAEVSNDFLSGIRQSAAQNQYADSDESRISSDNDLKLLTGMPSYARYPETATGLSDTDWNPYGTESDNNQSPRLQPQENGSDSKSSVLTSFTPLMNSTDINTVTPNMLMKISPNDERMSDILEQTERENTLSHHLVPNHTSDLSRTEPKLKAIYSPLAVAKNQGKSSDNGRYNSKKEKESLSSDEEKRMIKSTSSTGYSSATSDLRSQCNNSALTTKPLSVIERAKLMGIPEDILLDKTSKGRLSKTREFHLKYYNGPDDENESDDQLAKQVRDLLSDTSHLSAYDKVNSASENGSSVDYTVLQRDLQEIQDNLDSFGVTLQGTEYESKSGKGKSRSTTSSEGDIIPSTTTTPEKRKEKMLWDFAGDIGRFGDHQQGTGLFGEISLDTRTTSSQRPSTERPLYNSDGDETRTSESSVKVEDHAAADLALAEMSEVLPPSMRNLNSSTDVDRMVSTFQDQRRQLESRYQQLNNQGLAEKVFRILTNQNPESQANGILSEISADEKEMRARIALSVHDKNFNYSSTSSWLEEQNQSCNPQYDVRKKLDMSGVSSVDSSWMFDKSATKGFSALDDAKRLLSSQMMKASERTFNHSIEMRVPQTVQCYPLYGSSTGENGGHQEGEPQQDNERRQEEDYVPDQRTVEDSHASLQQTRRDGGNSDKRDDTHRQERVEEMKSNTSPNSSDQGSSIRPKDKYRPYRPPGSKEVYYTESDTASVADSVTTMESTHIGSDDARGPNLPSQVLGSRKDPPNVAGIYGAHGNLSTVREDTELTTIDEKSENNSESRNHSRRDASLSPITASFDMKSKEIRERSEPQASYRTHTQSPSSRSGKDQQLKESLERKRYDNSSREEARREPFRQPDRQASASPTHGIAAARRDAKWAHRRDEMNRDGIGQNSDDLRMRDRLGINDRPVNKQASSQREYDGPKSRHPYALPSDAYADNSEETGRRDENEAEPLSLRIRMTYTDDDKRTEKDHRRRNQFLSEPEQINDMQQERYSERSKERFERYSPELRHTFSSSQAPGPLYHRQGLGHAASDENLNSIDHRLSPAFRHALSPDRQNGLARTGSDENLSSAMRDARLSPAFRRALSPELRSAIERRSPLLSRHLERSLAQPPADIPNGTRAYDDDRFDTRTAPPTFLARERPLSPSEYRRRLFNDNSNSNAQVLSRGLDTRPRPRSVSPSYGDRSSLRHRSPHERENEATNIEDIKSYRVSNAYDQPTTKTKRKVELTLEGMSSESEVDLEMDQEPLSKRAQLLKAALVNESEPCMRQDVNAMWEKFKAMNESSSSSINSSKIEAVADLLKSPSRHLVTQYVRDREEYRIERQERAEVDRERRLREQQVHKQSSSEDEISERYAELLAMKEEERMRRRVSKKKKGKAANPVAEKKNERDNLFSIPEDRSHDPTPTKPTTSSKRPKPKVASQTHVIDPNMTKLRDRIAKQKTKVDKDMLKEMQRIEKLKKLESLLIAKKKGKISNETLQNQLDELSSTSAFASDFSHESGTDLLSTLQAISDDSTTAKDSSAEMHARKVEKERKQKESEMQKQTEGRKFLKEKNNNRCKNSLSSHSKTHPHMSEVRLLKLVKEGYLSAEEAYKLAMDRAGHDGPEDLDISRDSNNSDYSNGKRHKLYSPYSRSSNHLSQMRHVPKLKFSGSVPHSSYGMEDFEHDQQPSRGTSRKQENSVYDQSQRSRNRKERIPNSISPSHGMNHASGRREKSFSPVSTRRAVSSSASRRRSSASPQGRTGSNRGQHYSRKAKQTKKFMSENDEPGSYEGQDVKASVSWHIPVDLPASQWKEPQPRPQPFREVTSSVSNKPRKEKHGDRGVGRAATESRKDRKDHEGGGSAFWTKSSHPQGIPKLEWEEVVKRDALATKTNHWEVDPMMDRVQYILNRPATHIGDQSQSSIASEDVDVYEKPISKMSLQGAFQMRKQNFISSCSQRQKRMKLAREDRQLQECLRLEREAIFAEHERLAPANLYAHPYSDNLYQPKLRVLTKQEMKTLTAKRYNKLPEVIGKKEDDKKQIEAKLNRLRASLFNKKVQTDILRYTLKQRC